MAEIRPQAGRQESFLASPADIVIYGGGAGGGKTFGLLLEPLRHIANPRFTCVILRRTRPELTKPGGIWDEAATIYPACGGVPNQSSLEYKFPSGAKIQFAAIQHETDLSEWQSSQIALIEFDELTTFTAKQFWFMFSRNRSMSGVRPYVRAGCNPDPDSFVADLVNWWIGEDGYALPERAGVLRWFVRINDQILWADSAEELKEAHGADSEPKSLTFIPATVYDNKKLLETNPGYLANLKALPLIERERFLGGNWKIKPAAGKVFNRGWFEIVDALPAGGTDCRFWDFAATEKEIKKPDPDYTAGVLMRFVNGLYIVCDVIEEQIGPAEVERRFVNTTQQDVPRSQAQGARYMSRWEVEPGSASKREAWRLTSLLRGVDALGVPSLGDKLERARSLAAQAEVGNVKILRADWNERFLNHMHAIPDGPHDDVMDATAGAFNQLTSDGVGVFI